MNMVDRQTTGASLPHARAEPEVQGAGAYHILASASPADERTRVLKHNDTFAVFDHYGDIQPDGLGEGGLYHNGTRHLSCLLLEFEGRRPFFLSSTVRNESDLLAVSLTNPDLLCDGEIRLPLGTLHLAVKKFLWNGVCYHKLRVKNHALEPVDTALLLYFDADFVDIFEVRGMKRPRRGDYRPREVSESCVVLGYRGLDDVVRTTRLEFEPTPSRLTSTDARLDLSLQPQQETNFLLKIVCDSSEKPARAIRYDEARREAQADRERYMAWSCQIRTSNGQLNAWVDRAVSDLHMMTTDLPTGALSVCGRPMVQHAVWTRRHYYGHGMPVAPTRSCQRSAGIFVGHTGDRNYSRTRCRAGENIARDCAAARCRPCGKFLLAGITAALTARRCL